MTLSSLKSLMFWNVLAIPSLQTLSAGVPVISFPSKKTFPLVGVSRPVMLLKSVVFPAPLGPISPVIIFFSTKKSTLFTAMTPPNSLVRACVSSMLISSLLLRFHPSLLGSLIVSFLSSKDTLRPINHHDYKDKTEDNLFCLGRD